MAGIQNQPAPKPQSLPKTPQSKKEEASQSITAPDIDMFAPPSQEDMDMFAPPSAEELGGVQAPPPEQQGDFESPWYTEYLPTVGGIAGGAMGATAGTVFGAGVGAVPGAIGGAALGGAFGESLRDLIETQILGRKQKPTGELVGDIAQSGAIEGVSQAAGGLIAKGATKLAKAALPFYDDAVNAFAKGTKLAREKLEAPVLKMITEKATTLTPQESGDAVKNLLVNNIKGKYAPFIKAYGELDEIGSALPLADESRRTFTNKIKGWALDELGGDARKVVYKFADEIDSIGNGKQLRNLISQIGDARQAALQSGATNQANTLKLLQEQANDFVEAETTKLATRIAKGTASPQEMIGFERMMAAQKSPTVPVDPNNLTKYAKSVANDYLKSLQTVKKDYSGFKVFLEDVAEQTKTRINKKGPVSFMTELNDVPSEKLIERMFDPKNAAALKTMQRETPEVYDQVIKARMKNILTKSSPMGELDIKALSKEVNKLPEDAKKLLFSSDELSELNKVANNPRIEALMKKQKKWEERMLGHFNDVAKVATEKAGEKIPKYIKAPLKSATTRAIGNYPAQNLIGATETLNSMLSPQDEPLPRTVNGLGE